MTAGEGDAVLLMSTTQGRSFAKQVVGAEPVKTAHSTIKILEFHISPPNLAHSHVEIKEFRPFLTQVAGAQAPTTEYETTPLALRMLNIATGYSKNTLSCSELNGEHAGEGFRSLRHIHRPR